jgi:hypothetical protein
MIWISKSIPFSLNYDLLIVSPEKWQKILSLLCRFLFYIKNVINYGDDDILTPGATDE